MTRTAEQRALRNAQRATRDMTSRKDRVDAILHHCNEALECFGVEAIMGDCYSPYYGSIVALYVNSGDTYNATIVYDVYQDRFYATTMGDWVEAYERRGRGEIV